MLDSMEGLFPQSTTGYVRVAVDRGLDRYPEGLTYALDEDLADLAVGEPVIVPLGRGNTPTPGWVVERLPEPDHPQSVKHVIGRCPEGRRLPPDLVELARWIATYYLAPLGPTIAGMLPAAVRRRTGEVRLRLLDLAEEPPEATRRIPPKQRAVLEVIAAAPAGERPMERRTLARRAGLRTPGPIDRLVAAGWLTEIRRRSIEAAWHRATTETGEPPTLTADQTRVIHAVAETLESGFSTHLLHGVTGSGKTEVYLRLIEKTITQQRLALVLVPEISLTPQTGARLLGRFPEHRIAVLHSGLTQAQRHQQWSRVADDEVDIILGARSAVLAPLNRARLGLVVVDEEHDQSYKQDTVPRYHGRDVAIRLAQMAECPVLLGSATPSLESWFNARDRGRSTLHQLPERAPGLRVPTVKIVDLNAERRQAPAQRQLLIGSTLEQALADTLDRGAQALLLLNRRGFASYLACRNQSCGWMLSCDHCDVSMVMHRQSDLPRGGFVRCHHCLQEQRVPKACAACGGALRALGLGTQRIEEVLAQRYPSLVIGDTLRRIDSDTMKKAQDFHDVLEAFGRGDVQVLLGTQMIAKGLDYPGVQLVGVIDADTAVHLPDFRASERTYQLVAQVCGRCGRGERGGVAVVQTFNPRMASIQCAARGDYRRFAEQELEDRIACGLPPTRRMARLVIQDRDADRCEAHARTIRRSLDALPGSDLEIRGPSDCVISRIAQRHRMQLEILADSPGPLHRALTRIRGEGLLDGADRTTVDIDPLSLM